MSKNAASRAHIQKAEAIFSVTMAKLFLHPGSLCRESHTVPDGGCGLIRDRRSKVEKVLRYSCSPMQGPWKEGEDDE